MGRRIEIAVRRPTEADGAVDEWVAVDQDGRRFWASTEGQAFGMADDYNRSRPVGWSDRQAAKREARGDSDQA